MIAPMASTSEGSSGAPAERARSDMHAVVTGGTGALGGAVLRALRDRGVTCHVPVAHAAELARSPHRGDPGVRFTEGVDLRSEDAARAYFAALPPLFASVHLAGGFAAAPLESTTLADLERMTSLNLHTCFLACREAIPRIRAGGRGGRIVNVAARPAITPTAGLAAYAISKAAVASLTVTLAEELAPEGIFVNAVVPSTMDTPANRAAMPDADFSRWPKVEEVAEAIAFLASDANACVRGALVPVYGRG